MNLRNHQQRQKNKLEKGIFGALKMHNDCKVVHGSRYWQGLWAACQSIASGTKLWIQDAVACEYEGVTGGRTVYQNLTVSCYRLTLRSFHLLAWTKTLSFQYKLLVTSPLKCSSATIQRSKLRCVEKTCAHARIEQAPVKKMSKVELMGLVVFTSNN
jgi:hypothetical protein